jgi:ribosomal protein S18 acetylase RimI-like enzyme
MISHFAIRPTSFRDRVWAEKFIAERWGDSFVVAHNLVFHPAELLGFMAERSGETIGLITYQIADNQCEIITLDSTRPNLGIGTALVNVVAGEARKFRCARVWLVTTNDNLNAQRFYQRRGFRLVAVHRGAVEYSRQLKPGIPLIGADGIPIKDEIEFEMKLEVGET